MNYVNMAPNQAYLKKEQFGQLDYEVRKSWSSPIFTFQTIQKQLKFHQILQIEILHNNLGMYSQKTNGKLLKLKGN